MPGDFLVLEGSPNGSGFRVEANMDVVAIGLENSLD